MKMVNEDSSFPHSYDGIVIITTTKIEAGKFVIENKCPVSVKLHFKFYQLFLNIWHQVQSFRKTAIQKMHVDFGEIEVNKSLHP
jgi:hypothetical protein